MIENYFDLKNYLGASIKIHFIGNLSIYIRSEGCSDPGITGCGRGIIRVNGTDYSPHGRGYNLVTVNADTGTIHLIIYFMIVLIE